MRIVLLCLSFCICESLTAGLFMCDNTFDGIYFGISGGVGTNMAKTKSTTLVGFNFQDPLQLEPIRECKFYTIKPSGEFFAGWGKQFSCFYLGGRAGINFIDQNVNVSSITKERIRSSPVFVTLEETISSEMWCAEYTLDFKPGLVLCDRALLFGIVGGAYNKERLVGTSRFIDVDTGDTLVDVEISDEKKRICWGAQNRVWLRIPVLFMLNRSGELRLHKL